MVETEICVIGGGPAGASVALRLAQLGHEVCLVERSAFPRAHVGESLPPSILPTLDALGLRDRIETAGFLRPRSAFVLWRGRLERQAFDRNSPGFQVDRGRFDQLVLEAARTAGVSVIQPAQARRPRWSSAGWDLDLRGHPDLATLRARFLIDAAGKHAAVGRQAQRTAPRTAALYAYWQSPRGLGPETRVEAGSDHWYWGAALPGGTMNATVFLDTQVLAGRSRESRTRLYLGLVGQSRLLSACLDERRLTPVRSCDATCYSEADPTGPALLRVGEAAYSIDALSSQGISDAMGQALQAAAAAHTMLTRPERAEAARRFLRDRQTERVAAHAALAGGFFAEQAIHSASPFWTRRATKVEEKAEVTAPLPRDQPLSLSAEHRIAEYPIQIDDGIDLAPALFHPALDRPVAFLDGLSLGPLLTRTAGPASLRELVAVWAGLAPEGRAERALDWLWRKGILVHSGPED